MKGGEKDGRKETASHCGEEAEWLRVRLHGRPEGCQGSKAGSRKTQEVENHVSINPAAGG